MFPIRRRQGDHVYAKGLIGQASGLLDLLSEDLRRCVAPGQEPESARISHRTDQARIADPCHGAAHNWIPAPQKFPALCQKSIDQHVRSFCGSVGPWVRLPVCPFARLPVGPSARLPVCPWARLPCLS